MAYSMRCRNGQVNTSGGNSVACGEWDYSCYTYIHDSSRVDSVMHKVVSHEISNFSGSFTITVLIQLLLMFKILTEVMILL